MSPPRARAKAAAHIELHFMENGAEITAFVAVSDKTLEDAGCWIVDQTPEPPASTLYTWLLSNGGKLDREDGPACIERTSDGKTAELWYRNGKKHREDGPAAIECDASGTRIESWYWRGKHHREDGPAYTLLQANGRKIEAWYINGKKHREDGPAYRERLPDNTVIERWFIDNKRIKEIERKKLSAIPGVKVHISPPPPAPAL